jgi:asparagine synthase (glutamine-hydrolysing)
MCGIFGVCNVTARPDIKQFEKSLQLLKQRGPDFQRAIEVDQHVILGHARLSIIDLSASNHQPFSVDDRYTLTYNGEVYNYVEIKEELKARGIQFKTSGDTEVLLQSYITWGEECVKKFNGMWAFAIYDKELKKLFCSRDRFGVKPFSYFHSENEFIFSSEIKPIITYKPEIKVPNYNMIANYCYKSIGAQARETWFENIFRLPPAHNLILEAGKLTISRYWDYPKNVDRNLTFDDAKQKFEELFVDAVKVRMRSDVKVGSTLSSGLDSSSIVGVINKQYSEEIETFTAYNSSGSYTEKDKSVFRSDVDLDESTAVKKLTLEFNVSSNLIEVSFSDYLSKLAEAIYYLESGHSSPAIISIHQVYKEARKKVKVLLEGQGADELLAGYIVDCFPIYLIETLKSGKIRRTIEALRAFRRMYSLKYLLMLYLRSFDSSLLNWIKNHVKGIDIIDEKNLNFKYIKDSTGGASHFDQLLNKLLYKQHTSGLVNLLHYGDALSMAESIECRLPFMDYRLVEFAFTLPYNFKLNKMHGKYIQRKALEKYVPDYISKSLLKIGFATPLDDLFTSSKEIENILLHQKCGTLFNDKNVRKLLNAHRKGKENHATLLFRILSAKVWYKTFFG